MSLKTLRNVVFWSFVILYLILAPLMSFYALGYVFEPHSKTFVKTGIISLKSYPSNATVFVNEKQVDTKTPTAISRLLPGTYDVQVRAPHYQVWERKLNVQPEEVVQVHHILLVPEKPSVSFPVPFPVHHIIPSSDRKYLFLISKERRRVSVYAFDIHRERLFRVVTYDGRKNKIKFVTIESSDEDKNALISFYGKQHAEHVLAPLSFKTESPIFLSNFLGGNISNIRFHPHDSEMIYFLQGNVLKKADIDSLKKQTTFLKGVRSFEVAQDKIYFFSDDFHLYFSNLDGKEKTDLLPDRGLRRLLFGESQDSVYQIFLTAKENAFWLRQDGKLLMNRLPYFVDEDVKGASLSPESEKMIYWKSNELWLIELEPENEGRTSFFEKGPKKTLLWKGEEDLVQAKLLRGESHIILATNESILLVEITKPVFGNPLLVWKHKAGKKISFYFDDDSGKLYSTDRSKDNYAALQISKLLELSQFPFSLRFRKPYSSAQQIDL